MTNPYHIIKSKKGKINLTQFVGLNQNKKDNPYKMMQLKKEKKKRRKTTRIIDFTKERQPLPYYGIKLKHERQPLPQNIMQ